MSIAARCPACGKDYQLGERFAGKKVKCTTCGAAMRVPGGTAAADSTSSDSSSGARHIRSVQSGELKQPPVRRDSAAAPPAPSAPNAAGSSGAPPPVRAAAPTGPTIATGAPAGTAGRVAARRSGGKSALLWTLIAAGGIAAAVSVMFAMGVFEDGGRDDESAAKNSDKKEIAPPVVANGANGQISEPGDNGKPAGEDAPKSTDDPSSGEATPMPTPPPDPAPPSDVEPIEPIPAAGQPPPNAQKVGGFRLQITAREIELFDIDAKIEEKMPDVLGGMEEIKGPKLENGDEFDITNIQKTAYFGFALDENGERKRPGKLRRSDLQISGAEDFLVEDEDSILELSNHVVEMKKDDGFRTVELTARANTLLNNGVMKYVANLPHLKKIELLDTKIGDEGLKHLAGLTNLETLILSGGSNVTDAGLAHFKHLKKLQELRLDLTKISDAGLGHLAAMPWLKRIVLSNSDVTEEGAKRLRATLKKTEVVR